MSSIPTSGLNRQDTKNPTVTPCPDFVSGTGEAVGDPFPCLFSNSSIETVSDSSEYSLVTALSNVLSPYYKRAAETLHLNVARLISLAPSIGHVGFLTLTFVDNVTDPHEAYNRFRSLNSNFLAPSQDYGHWVCVKEPQKRGAWHYHLLIHVAEDIRTGVDFSAFEQQDYRTASPYLRRLWSEQRRVMPKYSFGRPELLPIRTNKDAMARYIGKYISKQICQREDAHKGVRLVNYSKGWAKNSVKFQWNTENSQLWRKKVEIFSYIVGCSDLYELTDKLGSDWAYKYGGSIQDLDPEISQEKLWEYCVNVPQWRPAGRLSNRVEKWQKIRACL